jgi:archaellum component FlaG (FlaF/FlaG flagellin family)
MIIGGVICSLAIFNGLYPVISESSGTIASVSDKVNDRIMSDIEIIQAGSSGATITAWVKNVGTTQISTIENSDILFGAQGNIARISFGDGGSSPPYWEYQIEGDDTGWEPTGTIKLTIHLESIPSSGTYMLKIVIPNGIYDDITFGV